MRKKIGIDIDGTVTSPSSLIPYINKKFERNLTLDHLTQYDLASLLKIEPKEFQEWYQTVEAEIYENSPIVDGALEVLKKWAEVADLYFISARPKSVLEVTKAWLVKEGVPHHHIELIGSHHKVETAKRLGVSLFLEDKHDNAVDISNECGIPVILFSTPYNQDPIPDSVLRMSSWEEADEFFQGWVNK